MIIYLCMKYESNSPMYSKDLALKPFFCTYVRRDKGDAISPHYKWRGHKNKKVTGVYNLIDGFMVKTQQTIYKLPVRPKIPK